MANYEANIYKTTNLTDFNKRSKPSCGNRNSLSVVGKTPRKASVYEEWLRIFRPLYINEVYGSKENLPK
jgi:hypothetical protein